jgi:elongator complex protein 6
VLRHLYSYLRSSSGEKGADVGVVLVSFMRDGAFWREGAGRLVSLPTQPLLRGGSSG